MSISRHSHSTHISLDTTKLTSHSLEKTSSDSEESKQVSRKSVVRGLWSELVLTRVMVDSHVLLQKVLVRQTILILASLEPPV